MAKRKRKPTGSKLTLDSALTTLEAALKGPTRHSILEHAFQFDDLPHALRRLRLGMSSHRFQTGSDPLALGNIVGKYDRKTRQEGLYVLHVWHHDTHRFLKGITPVLTLDYLSRLGIAAGSNRASPAILLDYYFLHILILCATRAWDEGDPNENLDRVTRLLGSLQGPDGSGFQFAQDSETLLLLAIAQYHPNEAAYDNLLARVRSLNEAHRTRVAQVMAAILGSHLRWGFPALYSHDLTRMRDDNVVDYPWLLFSLRTLIESYSRMDEAGVTGTGRSTVVEGILNGLTADPAAFQGQLPSSLSEHRQEYVEFCQLFNRYRSSLLDEFEQHRPSRDQYSPISFRFNFPHNAVLALIAVAVTGESGENLPLNGLLTRNCSDQTPASSPQVLAEALMRFSSPAERLDTRGQVQIVYDPEAGLRDFDATLEMLRQVALG